MKFRLHIFLFLVLLMPTWALGAGGAQVFPEVIIDRTDYTSLQKGAASFVSYCSGCHGMQHLRYGHISEDLGISEDILRKTIMPTDKDLGDYLTTAMKVEEAEQWFHGAVPPDLSLSARMRGKEWIYAYLKGFYQDGEKISGWNNTVFSGVAMPHVLADLQGTLRKDDNGELEVTKDGKFSPVEYDAFLIDLVNFMDYAADPNRPQRHRLGYLTLIILMILWIFAYLVYRDYWREIH